MRKCNTKRERLHATIEFHKPNAPSRPIINWKNAPAYELTRQLTKTLQNYLNLPYTYNVCNSNQLMTELKTIELNSNIRMCSFDIENMYTKIPRKHIINITNDILENNTEIQPKIQREIIL
jgi:galactitol-specific phosphotransferase system IIB component